MEEDEKTAPMRSDDVADPGETTLPLSSDEVGESTQPMSAEDFEATGSLEFAEPNSVDAEVTAPLDANALPADAGEETAALNLADFPAAVLADAPSSAANEGEETAALDASSVRSVQPPTQAVDVDRVMERWRRSKASAPDGNNVKPNTGYYSLPAANAAFEETEAMGFRLDAPDQRLLLGYVVAAVVGVPAGLVVLALALQRWASEGWVVGCTVVVSCAVALVVGAVVVPRDTRFSLGLRRAPLPIAMALAVVWVVTLPWLFEGFRSTVRGFAPDRPAVATQVMTDEFELAAGECARLTTRADAPEWRAVLEGFGESRPAALRRCRELTADAQRDTLLAERWYSKLRKTDGAEEACAITDALLALDRPPAELAAELSACAFDGAEQARSCCAQGIASTEVLRDGWVSFVTREPSGRRAAALAELLGEPARLDDGQRILHSALSADAEAAILDYLCLTHVGGEPMGLQLADIVADECTLELDPRDQNLAIWSDACAAEVQRTRRDLCEAATAAGVDAALDRTRRVVHHAAKYEPETLELARSIQTSAPTPFETAEEMRPGIQRWKQRMSSRFR